MLRTQKKLFHPPSLYALLSTQFSENAPFYRHIMFEKKQLFFGLHTVEMIF